MVDDSLLPPVVAPATRDQRAAFLVGVNQSREAALAYRHSDLLENTLAQLRTDLSPADRTRAEQLIRDHCDRKFEVETEKYAALSEHVRTHPDLANASGSDLARGIVGSLDLGVNDAALWGRGTKAAKVAYYLEYAKWPRLGEAQKKLRQARADLNPFLLDSRTAKPNAPARLPSTEKR